MNMLGFVYLVLILGWILIVLFLKCKKSITPHIGLTDNYMDATGSDQSRPSIHVIQLPRDDLENEEQLMDAYRQRSNLSLPILDERNLATVFTSESVVNSAYVHNEEHVINAPPPSYDEVMRQPAIYPKVINKITEANI